MYEVIWYECPCRTVFWRWLRTRGQSEHSFPIFPGRSKNCWILGVCAFSTHWHKVPEPSWQPALLGPLAPGKQSNPCQCRLTVTAHSCTLLRCFAMLCLTGPPRWWYKAARWSWGASQGCRLIWRNTSSHFLSNETTVPVLFGLWMENGEHVRRSGCLHSWSVHAGWHLQPPEADELEAGAADSGCLVESMNNGWHAEKS